MDPIECLHRRAAANAFTLTPEDGEACGLSRRAFFRHMRRLGWAPRYRGLWLPEDLALDHLAATQLAVRALGPPVAATAQTALWLDRVVTEPPATVQLLVPDGRRIRPHDDARVRTTTGFETIVRHNQAGVPVVAAWRAIADYAPDCSRDKVITVIAAANRMRKCPLDRVRREIEQRKRFPGRGRLRQAHGELTGELTHSRYEHKGRRILRGAGLSFHSRPYPVIVNERPIAEIDVAFVALRYGVEIDGPPHLLPDVAERDRRRDRQLQRHGWRIDRFLWTDLDDPARFVSEVTAGVEQRSAGF